MTRSEIRGCEDICGWLSHSCGIHYPEHKHEILRQRLVPVLREFEFETLEQLARGLRGGQLQALELAVMDAASTNHTYFFREPQVLEHFRQIIVPQLPAQGEIRIWSAAASSGDEAFTIAMILAETLGLRALSRVSILGTDLSASMIRLAEAAQYQNEHLQHMPLRTLGDYFRRGAGNSYEVIPEIRRCCTFRRMNLKAVPYPFRKPFHVTFCRNVLYYFSKADQSMIVNAMADVTLPDGWLVTSVTEPLREFISPWVPLRNMSAIYQRAT
ncbi:CheR family methyltransferase [Plastorhodobacter daqingensis]|uniref:protein-glutamate O-methyltransferase n=1 Tax=Plastorhodobacter daqingensis TaxID=1387281 RepID=A0ABW2UJZ3_9RHOB